MKQKNGSILMQKMTLFKIRGLEFISNPFTALADTTQIPALTDHYQLALSPRSYPVKSVNPVRFFTPKLRASYNLKI